MTDPTDPISQGGLAGALAALGAAVTGAIWWIQTLRTRRAASRAEVAEHETRTAVSEAEGGIVKQLLARVVALETDVRRLNAELDAERRLRRRVEDHVTTLEVVMRRAGLEPPEAPVFTVHDPADAKVAP